MPKLNNQGRQPEEVYYSWMRGFIICKYFISSIAIMFNIQESEITTSGDDDLENIETFNRTPVADLEIDIDNIGKMRLEIQSGFTGINDIKQHKVIEAKRVAEEKNIKTLVLHFDIFNGQVAVVRIDNIPENSMCWITRQQMEGQTVFNIDQNYFIWKLVEDCPNLEDIKKIIDDKQ